MVSKSERDRLQNERHQIYLASILKDDDNKYCADCDAKGPRWASWNIGVFLCIRCAGIHRNLGVHISKVKSVNLDTWSIEHLGMLYEVGNSRGRAVYEANLPDNFRRPQTDSALEQFIRNKYEHKRYIAREWIPPKPNLETLKQIITNMVGGGTTANGPGHAPLPGISKASSVLQSSSGSGLHTSSSMPQLPQPPSHGAHENGIPRPRASPSAASTVAPPASLVTSAPSKQTPANSAVQPSKEFNLLDLDMDTPSITATQAVTFKATGLEDLFLDASGGNGFGDFVSSTTSWPPAGENPSGSLTTEAGKTAQSSTKTKEDILSLYGTRSNNTANTLTGSIFGTTGTNLIDPTPQYPMGAGQQGHGFFYTQPPVNQGGFPPMTPFGTGYSQAPQSYWPTQQSASAAPNHLAGGGVAPQPNSGFGMQHNPFFANSAAPNSGSAFGGGFYPPQNQNVFSTGNYQQAPSAQQQMVSQQAYLEQIQQKLSSMQVGAASNSNIPFPQ